MAALAEGRWGGALVRIAAFLILGFVLALLGAWLLAVAGVHFEGRGRMLATAVSLVVAVGLGVLLLRRMDHRPAGALGFALTRAAWRESLLGLGIGVGALTLGVLILLVAGKLGFGPDTGTLGSWSTVVGADLALLAIAAASEEALFRGYPFQVIAQRFGPVAATVVGSVAFAWAHDANPSVSIFALVNIFLAGVLLSIAYLKTCSLWFATGVHLGWNWAMASLFDLPVSGITFFDTPLYEPVVGGPQWFTGGAFGPEGGLVGTVAFLAALLVVVKLRAVRIDDETRARRPLTLDGGTAISAGARDIAITSGSGNSGS